MSDSRIINVGGVKVGINGLDQVIEAMSREYAQRDDQEVGAEMLARLERSNYFAPVARDEYAAALAREFRKALGQPYATDPDAGLEVRVLGPGCASCDQLYERLVKVLSRHQLAADLDHVKDLKEITAAGVVLTPGLMINGKVVSVGKVPSESQLTAWLKQA
jgi:small redox-active disulfide protein 2